MSAVKKRRAMVYVIDDDESVRKALKRLLRSADVGVETFSSARSFYPIRGKPKTPVS